MDFYQGKVWWLIPQYCVDFPNYEKELHLPEQIQHIFGFKPKDNDNRLNLSLSS